MQIAIIKDNKVEKIGDHRVLFSNTSFPASGPPADWMTQTLGKPFRESHFIVGQLVKIAEQQESGFRGTLAKNFARRVVHEKSST